MSELFVYTTMKDEVEAGEIASHVVEKQLAACANILPKMSSIYRWQGKIVSDNEVVTIFKTTEAAFAKLEVAIKEKHSYECPCIIAIPIAKGHMPYLKWLNEEVVD